VATMSAMTPKFIRLRIRACSRFDWWMPESQSSGCQAAAAQRDEPWTGPLASSQPC
jgi:hypothetical protein